MSTFIQLQAKVETRLIDLPAAVQAEIPDLINEAMRTLQDQHNFRVMEAVTAETATVLATRELFAAMPTQWKEARGKPWYVPFVDGPVVYMEWSPSRETVQTSVNPQADGAPRFLLQAEPTDELGSRPIEVWPLPDGESDYSDGEYRIAIPYWKYVADLSADGDTNWFTINASEYLVFAATGMAFAVDWDEAHLAEWTQLSAAKANQVIKRDKLQRIGDVNTLVPHWQGVNAARHRE